VDDLAASTRLSRTELTDSLWDLVGRGLVAGDGFRPLRDLMATGREAKSRRAVHGRWSLVTRLEPRPSGAADLADQVAGQLLARYGVVFRELTSRESFTVPWRELIRALRRREARGLVRGGRFVAGFLGEQYALADAVEALRQVRRDERSGVVVRVRAADPCNLVGLLTPRERAAPHPSHWVVFQDGALVAREAPDRAAPLAALH
jgi:ATP-dependent Lhr-like helicase